MNLYIDHLLLDSGIMHQRVNQMKQQDLRPEYRQLKAVPSSNQDHSYLVGEVEVLTKPFPEADISADRTDILVCSCDDYWYNRSKGFENGDMSVTELGKCKHCVSAFRTEKAKADNNQTTLEES